MSNTVLAWFLAVMVADELGETNDEEVQEARRDLEAALTVDSHTVKVIGIVGDFDGARVEWRVRWKVYKRDVTLSNFAQIAQEVRESVRT